MYPAGVQGASVRLVTLPNGLLVRVVENGPAGGRPVLMVHGWGACVYSFSEQIPALAAQGYRVLAIDLPGHGLSEKPVDESHYTTRALAAAVMGVADALRVDRFTYVGHSMGGALGLSMAVWGERRLERLVAIAAANLGSVPILGFARLVSPRFMNPLIPPTLTRATITLVLRVAFGTPGRPTRADVDQYWAPTQFDEGAWACRALLHRFDFDQVPDEALRELRLPVLVITGGRDRLVPGGEHRAALIPNARALHVPEGGHLVMQECAERVNAEILRFLSGN